MPEARSYWDLRQIDSKEFVWMAALSMVFCFIWITTGVYFRTLAVLDTYVSMTLLTTELTNWDVCWWRNPIERDQVQTEPTPEWSYQNTHYNYLVQFPDCKFVMKIWHDVHERFVSASSLKLILVESSEEKIPSFLDLDRGISWKKFECQIVDWRSWGYVQGVFTCQW